MNAIVNSTNPVESQEIELIHMFELSAHYWNALTLFVNPKDIRYQLCGVNISKRHLTATNGHVLLSIEHGHDFGDFLPEHGITVEPFKAGTKRVNGADPIVTFTISEPGGEHYGKVSATCTATPGVTQSLEVKMQNFPDWQRVIPQYSENDNFAHTNHIDAKYMELIGKTGALLQKAEGRKNLGVNIRGKENSAMLATFDGLPGVRAVVMPVRSSAK